MSRAQGELLSVVDLKKRLDEENLFECPVAFEPFSKYGGMIVTDCGHAISEKAFSTAIDFGGNGSCNCSNCRALLTRDNCRTDQTLGPLFKALEDPNESEANIRASLRETIFSTNKQLLSQAVILGCGHAMNECDIADDCQQVTCTHQGCTHVTGVTKIAPHYLLRNVVSHARTCFDKPVEPSKLSDAQLLRCYIRDNRVDDFKKLLQSKKDLLRQSAINAFLILHITQFRRYQLAEELIKLYGDDLADKQVVSSHQCADIVHLLAEASLLENTNFTDKLARLVSSESVRNRMLRCFLAIYFDEYMLLGKVEQLKQLIVYYPESANLVLQNGARVIYQVLHEVFEPSVDDDVVVNYHIFASFLFEQNVLNPALPNKDGRTSLHLAVEHDRKDVLIAQLKVADARKYLGRKYEFGSKTFPSLLNVAEEYYHDRQLKTGLILMMASYFIEAQCSGNSFIGLFSISNCFKYIDTGLTSVLSDIFKMPKKINYYRHMLTICKYALKGERVADSGLKISEIDTIKGIVKIYQMFQKTSSLNKAEYLDRLKVKAFEVMEVYIYDIEQPLERRLQFLEQLNSFNNPLITKDNVEQARLSIQLLNSAVTQGDTPDSELTIQGRIVVIQQLFTRVKNYNQLDNNQIIPYLQQYLLEQLESYCGDVHSSDDKFAILDFADHPLLAWQPARTRPWCSCFCWPRLSPYQRQFEDLRKNIILDFNSTSSV